MVETELRNLRLKASFINESHLFLTSPTSPTYITFHMEQACFSDGASRFHKKSNQTKTLSIGVDQGIQCSVHRLRTIRCQGKQLHPIGYPQPWWISAVRKNSSILSMVDKGASKPQPSSWPFHPTAVALFLLNEIVRFLALNLKVLTKQGHGERITHFLQSGLNLWVGSAGSTTIAARSTVEFPGTVIREVPPRTTPIQFLRELEKRLRVKHRIHITACHLRSAIHSKFRDLGYSIPIKELTKGMSGRGRLLDAVQLAETLW